MDSDMPRNRGFTGAQQLLSEASSTKHPSWHRPSIALSPYAAIKPVRLVTRNNRGSQKPEHERR